MALLGLVLAMLLAAAVDLGRAFYTAVVVENMAGEGVGYAALLPDHDANYPNAYPSGCAQFPVTAGQNIQDRARQVAQDRGLIISQPSQAAISISPSNCLTRCKTQDITVTVTYTMTGLFLPSLVGMNSIVIQKSSVQQMTADSYAADQNNTCPAGP
jgi:hypothetical protein